MDTNTFYQSYRGHLIHRIGDKFLVLGETTPITIEEAKSRVDDALEVRIQTRKGTYYSLNENLAIEEYVVAYFDPFPGNGSEDEIIFNTKLEALKYIVSEIKRRIVDLVADSAKWDLTLSEEHDRGDS